ncbi:MAG: hypothetical protein AAB586_00865 [Patescibacteria group bacterium]
MDDDFLKDTEDETEEDFGLKLPHETKKRRDLIDDDVESVDELADDELDIDKEDLMDDTEDM